MAVTTAGNWLVGDQINLECALKLGDELGGHLVSGHVDGLAEIRSIENSGDSHVVWPSPISVRPVYCCQRFGCVRWGIVDGERGGRVFVFINIIPHTWSVTGWAGAAVGQKMNMEIDMLARYVARLADFK